MDSEAFSDESAFMTGWLQMCVSEKNEVHPDQPLQWQPRFCAIFSEPRRFVACEDNGTKEVFDDNDSQESPNLNQRNVPFMYRKRRSSAPSVPLKDDGPHVLGSSGSTSGSGLKSFLARRLAFPIIRSRSASKLGSKDKPDTLKTRLVAWRSHESLFSECEEPSHVESIDIPLRGMTVVRPVHGSVLSRQHCFQVTTPLETRYFTCSSAEDANNWIAGLKEILYPNRNKHSRLDTSLDVWIFEAKGIPQKKRYYCEVVLDKVLYARTSTKLKTDLLFWGEQFSFDDLPSVNVLSVHIFKENEGKKKRKEKSSFVGFLEIPIETVQANAELEKWFPLIIPGASPKPTPKLGANNKTEQSCVRVKLKYKTVSILPLSSYKELHEYIRHHYLPLCAELEPSVSIKAKDELAQTILKILQVTNQAKQYLADIIQAEVDSQENENLTFRGNTLATKSMDTYMKMVGRRYLQETLGHFINTIYDQDGDCEVDPTKLTNGSNLAENQKLLLKLVEEAWGHVLSSFCIFPSDLQEAFCLIRKKCQTQNKDVVMKLISGSVFLRFLCPAILSPSLFHLTQEYPDDKTARRLTLIAKTIQNLANFTRFGAKEEYMSSLNDFVEKEMPNMKHFLDAISVEPIEENRDSFDNFVDLGRELALLFELLQEHTKKLKEDSQTRLGPLMDIIARIRQRRDSDDNQNQDKRKRSWTDGSANDNFLVTPTISSPSYADCVLSCADDYVSGCSLISHTPIKPRGSFDRRTKGRANNSKLTRAPASVPSNMPQYGKDSHQSELRRFLSGTSSVGLQNQEAPTVTRSSSYHGRISKKDSLSRDKGSIKSTRLLVPQTGDLPTVPPTQPPDPNRLSYGRYSLYIDPKHQQFTRGSRARSSSEGGNAAKRSSVSIKLRNTKSEDKAAVPSPLLFNGRREGGNTSLVRSKVVKSQDRKSFLQDRRSFLAEYEASIGEVSNETNDASSSDKSDLSKVTSESFDSDTNRFKTANGNSSIPPSDSNESQSTSRSPALARRNEFRKARKQKIVGTSITRKLPEQRSSERSLSLDTNSSLVEFQVTFDVKPRADSDTVSDIVEGIQQDTIESKDIPIEETHVELMENESEDLSVISGSTGLKKEESFTRDKHSDSFVSSCSSGCMDPDRISQFSFNSWSCSSADEADMTNTRFSGCRHQSKTSSFSSGQLSNTASMQRVETSNTEPKEPPSMTRGRLDSREDSEEEVKVLRNELFKAQSEMESMQESCNQQVTKYKNVIEALRTKLSDTETKLQRQRREKEEQMKSIIARLMNVESELRKEQNEMQEIVHAKQRIIDVQERRIKSLDAANRRLMTALSQLRNKSSDLNGTSSEPRLETYDSREDDGREGEHV